jgi:hypothetical protein
MSGQLTQYVPVLDGSNYLEWARLMEAYLKVQKLWAVTSGFYTQTIPADAANITGDEKEEIHDWNESNDQALGNIILRLSPAIQPSIDGKSAAEVWVHLKDGYGTNTLAAVFKDFKEALNFRLNPNEHPTPQIQRLYTAYTRLAANKQEVPEFIKGMLLLNNLPTQYDHLTNLVLMGGDMNTLNIEKMKEGLVNTWENMRGRQRGSQSINKLSAIKRKRGDPNFQQQQQQPGSSNQRQQQGQRGNQPQRQQRGNYPQQQQQQQQDGNRQRGKRGGKKFQRQGTQGQGHSHIADVAALPAPTAFTIAHVSPIGLEQRVSKAPEPAQRTEGPYQSLNKALNIAEAINVPATTQTVKTLEERIGALAKESPWGKNTYAEDWEMQSEDEELLPTGCKTPEPDRQPCATHSSSKKSLELILAPLAPPPYHKERNPSWKGKEPVRTIEPIDADLEEAERMLKEAVIEEWTGYTTYRPQSPKRRAPTPEEAVDWGSDDGFGPDPTDQYEDREFSQWEDGLVHTSHPITNDSNRFTALAIPEIGKSKVYSAFVNKVISSANICAHGLDSAKCSKCKGKHTHDKPNTWLLDSGASAHFTYDKSDFISYTPITPRPPVKTAAHTIYVEGKGAVLVKHTVEHLGLKRTRFTRLFPVLYIPEMSTKLLSMGEFLQQGMRVVGNSQHISLYSEKEPSPIIQTKPLLDGHTLYWFDAQVTDVEEIHMSIETIYTVDYKTMHRRLGHPSKDVLRHSEKETKGFPKGIKYPSTDQICPGCAQGKMPASSHKPSNTRAQEPFEKIHSDLKSFPVESYHKYKYFISFFDDFSSYAWVTFLRTKGAAILALKQFIAMANVEYDATIKEWMSDAGGEYKSDEFTKVLKDNGIKILQSAPYTPQQNGRAERFMRTCMDKAQAMRLEACLPDSWWEFAVEHAVHIYNRTPLYRLGWQTPFMNLHGEVPDISHLRVFGCGAYVHIPEARRANKLSPKSEPMIYIGHTEGIKAYKFMRGTNQVYTSNTALFDETIFPRCDKQRVRGTTRLNEPIGNQPPIDAEDDQSKTQPIPSGTDDDQPSYHTPKIRHKRESAPDHDGGTETPDQSTAPLPPPTDTEQIPLRRSDRQRKIPTRPGNVYGDNRHPTKIIKDVERSSKWKQMVENQPGSSSSENTPRQRQIPGEFPETSPDAPPTESDAPLPPSEDEVDDLLQRLAQEGGVKFLDHLLAKAVPHVDLEPLDTSNIREWTYKDIMRMPKAQQKEWKIACREELEALRRRNVFELVDPPKGRKIIKNRWVFDQKSDGRKKARLVAKGFSQVEGVDYDEIFSPVVRFETVRMMLALAALEDWYITGLDVKTAFLYGELDEELYMEQPEGFKAKGQEHKVLRLLRAIYGLKQAALAWWKALDKSMAAMGCKRLLSDSGLFTYQGKGKARVVIIVYVDDVIFMGSDTVLIHELKDKFMKAWECRDLGDAKEFLRMRIKREKGRILIDQSDYLLKVVERFGLTNAKATVTPLPEGYQPLPNDAPVNPALRSKYQQVIGSLLYIMLGTRPDIAYAVVKLSQFAANPSEDHLNRALYICRYLLGTPSYALVFDGNSNGGFIAYADSDWASNPDDRRSTTGYMVKLANGVFSWNSRAQKTVALSSTEAEYMSLSDTSRQIVWIRSLFKECGYQLKPIPLCGDNQGSIFMASNPVQEKRIKHIDIRYHYIREVVQNKQVDLFFIDGAENPADMFTKNLGHVKFLKFREQLGLEFYSPEN